MKYHLGCGSIYLDGYHNVDFPLENHNVNKNIKVDQYANILTMNMHTCSEVRSSHVFEHFNYIDSLFLLYRWYKHLIINGLLRINIPDVEALSKALSGASIEKSFRIIRYLYGSHEDVWAFHINGWTEKTLSYALSNIGFMITSINKTGSIDNDHPNCSIELYAVKKEEKSDSELIKSVTSLFRLYKNGDTEFENNLESYFQEKFVERIKAIYPQ